MIILDFVLHLLLCIITFSKTILLCSCWCSYKTLSSTCSSSYQQSRLSGNYIIDLNWHHEYKRHKCCFYLGISSRYFINYIYFQDIKKIRIRIILYKQKSIVFTFNSRGTYLLVTKKEKKRKEKCSTQISQWIKLIVRTML